MLDEILDKAPEEFNLPEIMAKIEDKTPYILVAFQEMERMNILFREIKRSLKELDLGLKVSLANRIKYKSLKMSLITQFFNTQGELTISTDMENLMATLFLDQIPPLWAKRAYPSMLPLGAWYVDLISRLKELETWAQDFNVSISLSTFTH